MQWKTITSSIGNTVFGLWSNGQKMLTLDYKTTSDVVYLESADGEKRKFRYIQKGLFKKKIILQNEYGVELGKVISEGHEKYIEVKDTRYTLHFKNENDSEVEILNENNHEPVAVCSIENKPQNDLLRYSLLMVACFYLFQPQQYNMLLRP